jgi:hypothetical protein
VVKVGITALREGGEGTGFGDKNACNIYESCVFYMAHPGEGDKIN